LLESLPKIFAQAFHQVKATVLLSFKAKNIFNLQVAIDFSAEKAFAKSYKN